MASNNFFRYFPKGNVYKAKNWENFTKNTDGYQMWKTNLLSPQAVLGGIRMQTNQAVLYKSSTKRVTNYSKGSYRAQEHSGVNHLGHYFLSKHLFNLSFLRDPYDKTPSKRQSIEVVYQLGNYARREDGDYHCGLFLRPLLVTTNATTLDFHGWRTMQSTISSLVEDVDLSLPDHTISTPKTGYFFPLIPVVGHQQPYPDGSFIRAIYDQLVAVRYLIEAPSTSTIPTLDVSYCISQRDPPAVDSMETFPDEWCFGYGRNSGTSPIVDETMAFLDAIRPDVALHQNSSTYFGPLSMACYGCGGKTPMTPSIHTTADDQLALRWFDLTIDDPRSQFVESQEDYFCNECRHGEYKFI